MIGVRDGCTESSSLNLKSWRADMMDKGMIECYLPPSWHHVKGDEVLSRWRSSNDASGYQRTTTDLQVSADLILSPSNRYSERETPESLLSAGVLTTCTEIPHQRVFSYSTRCTSLCVSVHHRRHLNISSSLWFLACVCLDSSSFCPHPRLFAVLLTNKLKIKTLATSQSVISLSLIIVSPQLCLWKLR